MTKKLFYFPEPTKSWLIIKFETHKLGKDLFKNTKVKKINSGNRYLESFVATVTFNESTVMK